MLFAAVNGINLHYKRCGRSGAPALVFCNSLGTDFRIWEAVVPLLEERFDIVLYDKRGHGLSSDWSGPAVLQSHIDDLTGLMDHLEIGSAIIVGLSVGGLIAQGLQAVCPARVRAMMLCDTAHKIGTREMWNERIARIEKSGLESMCDTIIARWLSPTFRAAQPACTAGLAAMLVRTPKAGYLATCTAIREADFTREAGLIPVPALCVVGSEDASTPPATVRGCADLIPGSAFIEIPGAGHLPCIEEPALLARHFLTFVTEHDLG